MRLRGCNALLPFLLSQEPCIRHDFLLFRNYSTDLATLKRKHINNKVSGKIVKEALRMVLEAVYEPYFLVYSHGNRPGLGEHSALKEVRRWVGISWFLKFRVHSCDNKRMEKHFIEELELMIGDKIILDMIYRAITDKGLKRYPNRKQCELGRLCNNIHLHSFDLSVARTISLYKRGEAPVVLTSDGREVTKPFKRQGTRHILTANIPEYRRLWYVRHATEFMMGFIGTRDDASNIFHDAKLYVENIGIVMNERKSGSVADSMQNPASFLGFRIVCEDPMPDPENPKEQEWKARMHKLELIRDGDRERRKLQKYVKSAKNTLRRSWWESFRVKMETSKSSQLIKDVIRNLRQTIVGPDYRNIYHIMTPHEILLNKRTQRVFPKEITEAAQLLEDSLKAFVTQSKHSEIKPIKHTKQLPSKKEPIVKPTMTPPEFYAPIRNLRIMLNHSMFLCRGRPTVHPYLYKQSEIEIVEAFAKVANSILRYYKCSKNLERIKKLVDYNLRFACLRTLGARHKTTAIKIRGVFTRELIVPVQNGDEISLRRPFPSSDSIAKYLQGFMARENPPPPWRLLQMYSPRRL